MILHIEFVHTDNSPIVRGTVEVYDLPKEETDAIRRMVYIKQDLILTHANRFRLNVENREAGWSQIHLPVVDRRTKHRS